MAYLPPVFQRFCAHLCSRRPTGEFRPSLRVAIGVPFVLLFGATVSALTAMQYHAIRQLTRVENQRLLEAIALDTRHQLQAYLSGPFQLQRSLASDIADLYQYNVHPQPRVQQLLLRNARDLLSLYPHISAFGFASEDGQLNGFRRSEDGQHMALMRTDPQERQVIHFYADEQPHTVVGANTRYDPRLRPWYAQAIRHHDSRWTSIDVSADERQLVTLSASTPVRMQDLPLGVVTVDIALNSLSDFLRQQPLKGHGCIFIADRDGRLIAQSEHAPPLPLPIPPVQRPTASQSTAPLIHAAAPFIDFSSTGQPKNFNLDIDDAVYFGRVTPFHDAYGLHWQIVTLLPESDLLRGVTASTRTTLLWMLGCAVLVILLGLALIQRITRPIHQVAIAARALARGEFETRIARNNSLLETHALITAFNAMTDELQRAFRALREQLSRDYLTDLLSRQGLIDRADEQPPGYATLCFMGLDEWRHINEIAGYGAGDLLLQSVAQRLREQLPSRALLARVGSDELAVLFTDLGPREQPCDYAVLVRECFTPAFAFGANEVNLAVSIGYVSGYLERASLPDWMRNASIALRVARQRGLAQCVQFTAAMLDQSVAHNRKRMALRRALEHNDLCLLYQPIVHLADRTLIALKARLQWDYPERSMQESSHCPALTEVSELMLKMEHWTIQQACLQLAAWLPGLPGDLRLHIRISSQLVIQSGFVSRMQHVLQKSGVPGRHLTLEVTNSQLIEKDPGLERRLRMLKGLGVQLALADFGAGETSLVHLSQMPFDCFKISRRLVAAITHDDKALAIVTVILTLGRNFGARVIADGVDTEEQASSLAALGCSYGQGAYFGAADSAAAVVWSDGAQRL